MASFGMGDWTTLLSWSRPVRQIKRLGGEHITEGVEEIDLEERLRRRGAAPDGDWEFSVGVAAESPVVGSLPSPLPRIHIR